MRNLVFYLTGSFVYLQSWKICSLLSKTRMKILLLCDCITLWHKQGFSCYSMLFDSSPKILGVSNRMNTKVFRSLLLENLTECLYAK